MTFRFRSARCRVGDSARAAPRLPIRPAWPAFIDALRRDAYDPPTPTGKRRRMANLDLKNADPRLVARAIDYAGGESAARAALGAAPGAVGAGRATAGVF